MAEPAQVEPYIAPTSAHELLTSYAEGERFFADAKLIGAELIGANLSDAKLNGADLSGAKLSYANLNGADLSGAKLSGADLSRVDLFDAKLIGAVLSNAKLSYANLSRSDLVGAKLVRANLIGAKLTGAKLIGANLNGADLSSANLNGATFVRAAISNVNLFDANLSDTNLSDADLSDTSLIGANLSGAKLIGAKLTGAKLIGANLNGADLSSAKLNSADLSGAGFVRADLSGAKLIGAKFNGATLGYSQLGRVSLIEFCKADPPMQHAGPSSIDFESITMSLLAPNLEDFLVRAGIPHIAAQYMIESAQAVKGSVWNMMQSVFISYGTPDEAFARKLYEALHSNGVRTFYFAEHAEPGEKLHRMMRKGVNEHERIVLVCSQDSLDRKGVLNEIEETLAREARDGGEAYLIPIRLDDYVFSGWKPSRADIAQAVRDRVVADFTAATTDQPKFDAALSRLLRALRVKNPAPTFR